MKIAFIAVALSLALNNTHAQVKTSWAFNYRYGELSPNVGLCVFSDGIGNVYNTGFSAGAPGRNDMIIAKFSINGNLQWIRRFSDTITPYPNNSNSASGLLPDSENNLIVSGTRLWKFNQNGELLWSMFPGPYKGFARAFLDDSGMIISSTEGNNNSFLIRKNSEMGDSVWSRVFRPTGTTAARWRDAAVDHEANIVTTGYMNKIGFGAVYDCMTVKYSNDGELLWYDRIDEGNETFGYAVAADNNGNIYVAGEKDLNILTVKYAPNGDTLWQREFNGGSGDIGFDIQVDSLGNSYVSGVSGGLGIVLIKYDPSGNLLWLRNHTDVPFSVLSSIVRIDSQGNPYLAFSINSSGGRYEYAVAKYDSEGDLLWLARYNYNNQYCEVYDFTIDRNFDVYVTGRCGSYLSTVKLIQYMTSSTESDKSMISGHDLIGNFPNPFNPSTMIRFDIGSSGNVSLKVFDVLGREVEVIVNEFLKPGSYSVQFSGDNLPSGVYYYELRAEGFSETKRMLLVK